MNAPETKIAEGCSAMDLLIACESNITIRVQINCTRKQKQENSLTVRALLDHAEYSLTVLANKKKRRATHAIASDL